MDQVAGHFGNGLISEGSFKMNDREQGPGPVMTDAFDPDKNGPWPLNLVVSQWHRATALRGWRRLVAIAAIAAELILVTAAIAVLVTI